MNADSKRAILRAIVTGAAAAVTMLGVSACATIMHGTGQDVGISSTPTGAVVSIDNLEKGKTPLITKLSRKDNHVVKIELAGYQPYEATVVRNVSGWVWGNIVFGGLIGLGVDAMSGGLYKLSPEQVTGTLTGAQSARDTKTDDIYVAVVLRAEPGWVKIGQLQRE
jgi:hypothetical protein